MAKVGFEQWFNGMAAQVHDLAVRKGWWGEGTQEEKDERNDGELIALVHSELSECLEGLRVGNPTSEKLGEPYTQAEEELADVVIRVMDYATARGWNVGGAIEAKRKYNEGRTHRHGGKAF